MASVQSLCRSVRCIALASAAVLAAMPAMASPWIEVGDAQSRSDIELLAGAGLIDDVTTQWPLPWAAVLRRLDAVDPDSQPYYIKAAIERLEAASEEGVHQDQMQFAVTSDVTNLPDVVRGFDALGREDAQGQVSAEWVGKSTAINIQIGAQTLNRYDKQSFVPDGSYIAQRIGGLALYGGYVTHWWGPGWDTALSLSNNARPFPQIGWRRVSTAPFKWPVLNWLGPWNHEMFFGVLEDPRLARNTIIHGMRWSFNPFDGFEIAGAHVQELCGTGHPCEPIAEYFNVQNGNAFSSKSKDEIDFDLRYTNTIGDWTYALYNQEMDRDSGPFVHSDTNHVFGASLWVPFRETAIRFTAEYADTISTENFFSFGKDFYGITYTDYKYTDGWEYRGRTLGSSLDTDSRLASFHASWAGPFNWTYTLTYYRASIGSPNSPYPDPYSASGYPNRVTTAPVTIDIGEAKVHFPFQKLSVDVAVRLQDDQPRPDRGFAAAGELAINYHL